MADGVSDTLTSPHLHGTDRHRPSGVSARIASGSFRGYPAAPWSSSLKPGMDARCRGMFKSCDICSRHLAGMAFGFYVCVGDRLGDERPAWQAVVTEIVPKPDLTAAVSLNAVSFNLARAIGPALGGLIVAKAGAGHIPSQCYLFPCSEPR
jgi:hypothetical protein